MSQPQPDFYEAVIELRAALLEAAYPICLPVLNGVSALITLWDWWWRPSDIYG